MSVRIFLTHDAKNSSQYRVEQRTVQERKGPSYLVTDYFFGELKLYIEQGRFYVDLQSLHEPVPFVLMEAGVVDGISFHYFINLEPHRENGIYVHETAQAEVTHDDARYVRIQVVGKEIEDVAELYLQIREGSIRPTRSYDGPQDGLSRENLLRELWQKQSEIETLDRTLAQTRERMADVAVAFERQYRVLLAHVMGLMSLLREGSWPFCTKKKVVNMLKAVIFNTTEDTNPGSET